MKKLLFFDIDGTLLAGGMNGYVPESAIKALQLAQANGHICIINSGRTRNFMPKVIKDFPFDGYIYGCGTEIELHGQIIYQKELPDKVKRGLLPILHQANVQIVAEGPEYIYYEEREDLYPDVKNFLHFYDTFDPSKSLLKTFDEENLDFSKFVMLYDKKGDPMKFKELVAKDFQYIPRETMGELAFAEIVPHGCSKATGIDYLVEYFGLTLDDCYVFGDSNNDLTMLSHVKHSIAMAKSSPDVLKMASYITSDIHEDGIWNAMKYFGLI